MFPGDHTSKSIIGSKSRELWGKKIVLCITGSVAAIKSPEIARELMRRGADVYAVMTPAAQRIIHPDMVWWATGNPVVTELTGAVEHVTLAGEHEDRADLILVAPSTANTIGKIAAAIDDTPVTTTVTTGIGAGVPVVVAPAMHASMYNHPLVDENIKRLESIGVEVLKPRVEEGKAKIPGTVEIVEAVVSRLAGPKDLEGRRVLVTAGPTRAYLDAFRFITNPSSGKMGVELARVAAWRGAEVTLVYGPGSEAPPPGVRVLRVETTEDLLRAVEEEVRAGGYDAAIMAAAASDFGPEERVEEKTPSQRGEWVLRLRALPKVIDRVKELDPGVLVVGFKAEYGVSDGELVERALGRLRESGLDLVVANDVAREKAGFAVDTNEVFIVGPKGLLEHLGPVGKREVARRILDYLVELLRGKAGG